MKNKRETLSRHGRRFLERWGFETRFGGVYLHHLTAPDPGIDHHDHPWWFLSIVLNGRYSEEVIQPGRRFSMFWNDWRRFSIHTMRLDQAHRIYAVAKNTWTLVIRGPRVRRWGFYTDKGFIRHDRYEVD